MAPARELEDSLRQLVDVIARLHHSTIELRRTIHASRKRRRTPEDIRAALDRARRVVYRSRVLRRTLGERLRIQ